MRNSLRGLSRLYRVALFSHGASPSREALRGVPAGACHLVEDRRHDEDRDRDDHRGRRRLREIGVVPDGPDPARHDVQTWAGEKDYESELSERRHEHEEAACDECRSHERDENAEKDIHAVGPAYVGRLLEFAVLCDQAGVIEAQAPRHVVDHERDKNDPRRVVDADWEVEEEADNRQGEHNSGDNERKAAEVVDAFTQSAWAAQHTPGSNESECHYEKCCARPQDERVLQRGRELGRVQHGVVVRQREELQLSTGWWGVVPQEGRPEENENRREHDERYQERDDGGQPSVASKPYPLRAISLSGHGHESVGSSGRPLVEVEPDDGHEHQERGVDGCSSEVGGDCVTDLAIDGGAEYTNVRRRSE